MQMSWPTWPLLGRLVGNPILLGWSEGDGLVGLAAAAPANKGVFRGVIAVGLSESGVLGWKWSDNVTYITRREPNEPHCAMEPYLPRIAPLPLAVIQSSGDEYTPLDAVKRLFAAAGEPKLFRLVEARSHRFDGNRDVFLRTLNETLEWIRQCHP